MAAQTIAAQVAELVGTTAPASLDDWGADAVNKLYSLLPYSVLAPFSSLESWTQGTVASATVTPASTFPITGIDSIWTITINGVACTYSGNGGGDGTSLSDIVGGLVSAVNSSSQASLVTASDATTYVAIVSDVDGTEFTITSDVVCEEAHTLTTTIVTTGEITPKDKRILEVSRLSASGVRRICREVSPEEYIGEYSDTNSMRYPTAYDPLFAKYGNLIKVLPAETGMTVYVRNIPLLTSLTTSATSISTLPLDAEYLVVLDLAIRTALNKVGLLVGSTYAAWKTTQSITVPPSNIATILGSITTALGNEDVELASGYINELEAVLKEHSILSNDAAQSWAVDMQRLKTEQEKYFALASNLRSEYYEQLYVKFGVDLRPKQGKN